MNIDGKNTLACLCVIDTEVKNVSRCRPLPYFTVIRDLVVDMTHFYTQYKSIQPVLKRKTTKVIIKSNKYRNRNLEKKNSINQKKIEKSLIVIAFMFNISSAL